MRRLEGDTSCPTRYDSSYSAARIPAIAVAGDFDRKQKKRGAIDFMIAGGGISP